MGKDFFRLVELAIASGALIIPGIGMAGDSGTHRERVSQSAGLVVQSAQLDASGLTLQFSKPLRSPESIDPSKFRLTFAYYSKGRPGDYSYYHQYYAARRPTTTYENVGALGSSAKAIGASKIRIPAGRELNLSSLCKEIAAASSASRAHAGLYLHYAASGSRQVESADGAVLASVAPYWLTKEAAPVRSGAFEGRPIPVRVSCR